MEFDGWATNWGLIAPKPKEASSYDSIPIKGKQYFHGSVDMVYVPTGEMGGECI